MEKYIKNVTILLLYTIFCISTKGENIPFEHLNKQNGLSHYNVLSIYQDEKGLMWFGTTNGANLYNGRSIKTYKKEGGNSNSLCGNHIHSITGNKKGKIFFGTQTGISMYDTQTETFKTIFNRQSSCLFFYKNLYAASQNQVFKYDGSKFQLFYEFTNKHIQISRLYITQDSILIGTKQTGLYLLDVNKKISHPIQSGSISCIFKDSSKNIWITESRNNSGLYLIQNGQIKNIKNTNKEMNCLTSNFTQCCCEDKDGNIWIGTFCGLTKYNPQNHKFTCYATKENPRGLSHLSIWNLYCDNQGTIWAGTYFGGVNFFNPHKRLYHIYSVSPTEQDGLSSGIIGRMTEDNKHNLWICTEGGGLNKYNRQTNSFQWFRHSNRTNSISHNNVKTCYYDSTQNCLWIGTHLGGLNRLDLKTEIFTHYFYNENQPNSIPSNIISDIIPYKNETLLLATNNGIGVFDTKNKTCHPLIHNQHDYNITISTINLLIDKEGTLWIVNNRNGIYSYNFNQQKLTSYQWPSKQNQGNDHDVNSVYEDSKGRIWFCTNENGISIYHKKEHKFEILNTRNCNLASNLIYNVCEIDTNKFLLTTDKGISILNYCTKQCINYTHLPLDYLKDNALYRAKDNTIFIGGVSGMISFNPSSIHILKRSYNIFPSRLIINNKEINVGDNSHILQQSLSSTSKIILKPGQNIFHIEYAITDYIPFSEDKIYYRLKGFSNQWNLLNQQNTITYSNLEPGNYTLEVIAQNLEGEIITQHNLQINVRPPLYQTYWAYGLYILGSICIILYLIKTYKSRIKLQESLKYEHKHAEDIEKLNQAKLHFFTNISHEFRTPLTLIISQIESLLQIRILPTTIYNKLCSIHKNSIQLKELINELLDFRKQEQGHMTIKVSEHDIIDFVYKHFLTFQEYAKQKKINFEFRKTHEYIPLWFDGKHSQKVINNLLSNAFKHTQEGGIISISISKRNQEVIIEVTDNGDGISPKDINKIFEQFYQTEESELLLTSGSGIGLALTKEIIELHHGSIEVFSELNEGSTFCIHLKCGNTHFSKEQLHQDIHENITSNLIQPIPSSFLTEKRNLKEEEDITKKKILIVEDNKELRDMLSDIFQPFYTIMTAENGMEGLKKVQSILPDILISDVIMPKMSGIELCQAIKKDINTCHIPIILLTAKNSIENTIEGLTIGADDYISKPFNLNILLARCNNLINNRIRLQEKFSQQPQNTPYMLATNEIDKQFIDQIIKTLEEHIDDVDFKVDALVEKIGISRTRVFNKIKSITGLTPSDFIMNFRLKKAAILLNSDPKLNISEIADKLGFSTPKYFSKCFKEKYNITPQEYRRKKKKL